MKQKSKIRKRKFTTATKGRQSYMFNGHQCARGTKKLTKGVLPWMGIGTEFLK
jgi:hypothetical protein